MWSNLAAVHYENSRRASAELLDAASAVLRALRFRPDHPQALYNAGLIFEAFPLPAAAEQAWLRAAAIAEPGDAEEIERHLREARSARTLAPGGLQSRVMDAVDLYLPAWSEAVLAGSDASAAIHGLEEHASARAPDLFLRDLGATLRAASWPRAIELAETIRGYLAGRRAYKERHLALAVPLLREVLPKLEVRSPALHLAAKMELQTAIAYNDLLKAEKSAAACEEEAALRGYLALQAGWAQRRGLWAADRGAYAEAIGHYQRSRKLFRAAGERLDLAVVPSEAEAMQRLGLQGPAWQLRLESMAPIFAHQDPKARHNLLFQMVDALFAEGRFELAAMLTSEMLANAQAWQMGAAIADALRWSSRIAAVEGRGDFPRQALEQAEAIGKAENPGHFRERLLADVAAMSAHVLLATDPELARERATRALESLEASGQIEQVPMLRLTRARAWQALGRPAEARADLEAALAEVEMRRELAPERQMRVLYLALHQAIFDELVRADLEVGDVWAAFEAADRARSRALADRLGRETFPVSSLPARLREGEALIEWHLLAERLVIFRLDRQGLVHQEVKVGAAALAAIVARVQEDMAPRRENEKSVRPLLADLFDHLVRPAIRREDRRLILVPDGVLLNAPFAALLDRETERYLVENVELSIAPSADLAFAGRTSKERRYESVLAVGDPAFDEKALERKRLEGAAREAQEVAALYPDSTVLLEGQATGEALLSELRKLPSVVHLATHSLPQPGDPEGSALVMAGGRDVLALEARRVAGEDLQGIELVVLAACGTLEIFPAAEREGMAGWAEALLAAGVPTVAATLWSISDLQSTSVLHLFHQGLREGLRPATACAKAQRRMIRSENERERIPARWAFLELVTIDN